MALRRYRRTPKIKGGTQFATPRGAYLIYKAVKRGRIQTTKKILREGERLDIIAGKVYGNSKLWWIIAAASGIGWGVQAPPGTVLLIPKNLSAVGALVG